jgi:hypothetical protein
VLQGAESSNSPARAARSGCVARLALSGGNIPALAPKNVPAVRVKASALRPNFFYDRRATCWQPRVKGLTVMVNSISNGARMEDVWLDN